MSREVPHLESLPMTDQAQLGELSIDALRALAAGLSRFHQEQFDEPLSEYRARLIVDYLNTAIGTKHYNKAIEDAQAFFSDKLLDLDATLLIDEV